MTVADSQVTDQSETDHIRRSGKRWSQLPFAWLACFQSVEYKLWRVWKCACVCTCVCVPAHVCLLISVYAGALGS